MLAGNKIRQDHVLFIFYTKVEGATTDIITQTYLLKVSLQVPKFGREKSLEWSYDSSNIQRASLRLTADSAGPYVHEQHHRA